MLQETFYPCTFVNASRVFYAIADMESGSERKAKDGKVTKKNREIHRIKQPHPPGGGVFF
ncbi:hypothetical protein HMPREF9536_04050, partial [Escherichia coli MS 84-1]